MSCILGWWKKRTFSEKLAIIRIVLYALALMT